MKKFFPTKDEVIKKIEFITNGIKELLMKAKEGKHEQFKQCSEKICNFVANLIDLFPEFNQALITLQKDVLQLHGECLSYNNVPRFQSNLLNQDNRFMYNNVIDKAAEVATAVKSIINLYTIQQSSSSTATIATSTLTTTTSKNPNSNTMNDFNSDKIDGNHSYSTSSTSKASSNLNFE
ncbi:ARF GTPase-activating protein GIT2-like protein 1 [Sarcoptes scabiei]|uniref:ARF GTPase-activating protein GIT2-like protein 1 n=1 Tax=Sarcoptes scabiei TaxID=52283 RepID=A0A131ZWU8_SARSC|nr:ARF GTPase-activating protein GIT2-like protein 1 [Sarcoptes scabiei]